MTWFTFDNFWQMLCNEKAQFMVGLLNLAKIELKRITRERYRQKLPNNESGLLAIIIWKILKKTQINFLKST